MSVKQVLLHGDYREALSDINDCDLIFTSPPYNIGSKSEKKIGGRKIGGYDAKNFQAIRDYPDSLNEEEYQQQQVEFIVWCSERLKDTGVLVYNHMNRRKNGKLITPLSWILKQDELFPIDEITWDKGSTHNHCNRFTYKQSEKIYILAKTNKYYFKNKDLLGGNKGIGDVLRVSRETGNRHNAPFPLALAEQIISIWSPPGGLVCDPYSGSGTVMRACRILDRSFVGSERLRKYYNLSMKKMKETRNDCVVGKR